MVEEDSTKNSVNCGPGRRVSMWASQQVSKKKTQRERREETRHGFQA